MDKLARLQRLLGHEFADQALLSLALSHRSVGKRNNERLEFLGDSILNHVIAEALYYRFPKMREGELSRLRASLVRRETLAEVGRELELGDHLLLGGGEAKSGGRRRGSIQADTVEALLGAVLLDGGYEACRGCIRALFEERIEQLEREPLDKDPKTRLQEFLQGRGYPLPHYQTVEVSGEDHNQQFTVSCELEKPSLTTRAVGPSRRKAEQLAARAALEALE